MSIESHYYEQPSEEAFYAHHGTLSTAHKQAYTRPQPPKPNAATLPYSDAPK